MKKIITSAALLLVSAFGFAQDLTIKATIKIEGLPAEYAALGESEKITYIKETKSKFETISMMGNTTKVFDGTKVTMISDAMGNKTGWTATKEEIEATKEAPKKDDVAPKVEFTKDKKTIAGYECTKAIVTVVDPKEKKEIKFTIWYTDKIKKANSPASSSKRRSSMDANSFDFKEIPGFQMSTEFEAENQGMAIKYVETVTEVSTDKIEDSAFILSTEGYKMITYKEMQEKMKAMAESK